MDDSVCEPVSGFEHVRTLEPYCESIWAALPIRKDSISLRLSFPHFTQKKEYPILRVSLIFLLALLHLSGHHTLAFWPSCSELMDVQDLCPCHSLYLGHVS